MGTYSKEIEMLISQVLAIEPEEEGEAIKREDEGHDEL